MVCRRRAPSHRRRARRARDARQEPHPRCRVDSPVRTPATCGAIFSTSLRTLSISGPTTTASLSPPTYLASAITCASIERPATPCSTLGIADFMRVPLPAARMTVRSERLVMEDGSLFRSQTKTQIQCHTRMKTVLGTSIGFVASSIVSRTRQRQPWLRTTELQLRPALRRMGRPSDSAPRKQKTFPQARRPCWPPRVDPPPRLGPAFSQRCNRNRMNGLRAANPSGCR